jgi:hypothetical protein
MIAAQNIGIPGQAATDLGGGLGDALKEQAQAAILERRKKILAMTTQAQPSAAYGILAGGTGLNSGLGNMGVTAASLLGGQ